jgi:hypothetical protein
MSGFTGAPGLMQFYWNGATPGVFLAADATTAIAAVRALILGCAGAISATVAMQVQPTVEVLEATTGQVISVVSGTPVANVAGTASGSVTAAQGPLVQWLTGTVVGRRLLRGRTFLTPSATGAVQSNGLVTTAITTQILAAGATYLASSPASPVIWHRPKPFGTGTNGVAAVIAGVNSPSKVSVLRSRRD